MKLNAFTLTIENDEKANKRLKDNLLETTRKNMPWIIFFFFILSIVFLMIYLYTADSNGLYYTAYNAGCLLVFVF
jgi:hypothetical protein